MKARFFYPLFLLALLVVAGGKMYGQQIVYEPYDFRQVNADGDTLYYRITSDTEPYTVAVTRCHDSTYHLLPWPSPQEVGLPGFVYPVYDYDTLVNVPPTVTFNGITYTVTSVDKEAFYYQLGLKTVNLPPTISTIDEGAFFASSLSQITMHDGVQHINWYAFGSTLIRQINLPHSLLDIGPEAFRSCHRLQSIIIPENVNKISQRCFSFCDSLYSVILPEGLDTIEMRAFYATSALKEIIIPSQVKSIGELAFTKDNSLIVLQGNMFFSIKCEDPPTLEWHAISYDSIMFEVPCGALGVYQNSWHPDLYVANSVEFIDDCDAVEEHSDYGIRVYPNPTSDVICIEGMADGNKDLYVYDMLGNVVVAKTSSNNDVVLNISDLSRGLYLLKITVTTGHTCAFKICKN